jgi:hypothetical protein
VSLISKNPITLKNVFDVHPYMDILHLLIEFDKDGGLTFEQLCFILLQEDEGKKPKSFSRIEKFFMDPKIDNRFHGLQALIDKGYVKRKSIKKRNDLNGFLRRMRLEKFGLEIILREKKQKQKPKWRINKDFYGVGIRIQNKDALDFFSTDAIIDLDETIDFPYLNQDEPMNKHVLYGITKKTYTELDYDKQQKIEKYFKTIEENLGKIQHILIMNEFNKVFHILAETKSETIKHFLTDEKDENMINVNRPVSLLYTYIWALISVNYRERFKIPRESWEGMIEAWVKRVKKGDWPWMEKYHFSSSDIREIVSWIWENRDFFYRLNEMTSMTFSRYQRFFKNPMQSIKNPKSSK